MRTCRLIAKLAINIIDLWFLWFDDVFSCKDLKEKFMFCMCMFDWKVSFVPDFTCDV